jgi:hypothetical protein
MADDYESIIKTYEDIAAGYESMSGAGTQTGSINVNPNSSGYGYQINRTGSTPSGYYGSYSTPGGNLITIGSPPVESGGVSTTSGARQPSGSSGRTQKASTSYSVGYQGPTVDKPEYQMAEFQSPDQFKAPEYAPPDQDPAREKELRQEYMASGMRQVRKSTSEAIISSKSLDNPNAQALFIEKALSGVGDAVSEIAGTAGKEARSAAQAEYAQEMSKYNFGWKALADEAKVNYDAEWNQAVMDFQEQQARNRADYQLQASVYGQMPLDQQASGLSSGGTSGRTGSEFYQSQLDKMLNRTWG